ncbi:hypothetical protein SAMN04488065_2844 [Haloplanus vescus]|uniref:Gamma-glutamyl:cysteine ligase YbdK, ATP-grasp superfamily n=1 Tax=Haloplanus vescus TaxID=555874 RepID=A0A1H4ALF0_9EURY|nr:hypothetical protein [Haloplanus vescus]SEA36494.1 hypothetical protein SAMN04488065_2844 [Haloplanus vescus]
MGADRDLVDSVERSLAAETREEFDRRVRAQADRIRDDIRAGRLDTGEFAIGLELEAYAVDGQGRLARIPEDAFERGGFAKELGVHNLELNTAATVFDAAGVAEQADRLKSSAAAATDALEADDLAPVLDAMWTIPPAMGTDDYLGSVETRAGITVAEHMRQHPRYVALDEEIRERSGGRITLDVPGVSLDYPTILLESLATSMQPHLQVPAVEDFPAYFNAAVRTLGPVLSLTSNAPFLPADCYDDDPDIVEATPHELRIHVFEQSINADAPRGEGMVRFPDDVSRATDVVDRVVADETYAPVLADGEENPDDYRTTIREYDHKRGVHWRWVRGVVGGQPVGAAKTGASLRIEYRPIPTQPTVRDTLAVQLLVVGLVRGLVAADHPVTDLPWTAARDCFYDAVARGPDADLAWVTASGDRTDDSEVVYDELFAFARRGLREAGLDDDVIDGYLDPVERRRDGTVPSAWKKARVREAVADGATLSEAIERMQRAYFDHAGGETAFVDW